jgi:hypothetical protein
MKTRTLGRKLGDDAYGVHACMRVHTELMHVLKTRAHAEAASEPHHIPCSCQITQAQIQRDYDRACLLFLIACEALKIPIALQSHVFGNS